MSFTHREEGMLLRDETGRERRAYGMFAAVSDDEGKSWPWRRLVTAGGAAREVDGGGNTGRFTMDAHRAESKGYLAATQTPDDMIHLITSKQYYAFDLAWIQAPGRVQHSTD